MMYGTIARMRLKPGMEKQLLEQFRIFVAAKVPGSVTVYCYRMDTNPNEYYMAAVFSSKEAYQANPNGMMVRSSIPEEGMRLAIGTNPEP